MGREALTVIGSLVGVIIALTIISGGNFQLATGPAGPSAVFGFTGPQHR